MLKSCKTFYKLFEKTNFSVCGLSRKLKFSYAIKQVRLYSNPVLSDICVVPLSHRSVLKLSGKDSVEFLQGLVTNDVTKLAKSSCMYAMILNSKGRVMHDVLIYRPNDEDTLLLECQFDCLENLNKTLNQYKLRKKVKISVYNDVSVWQVQLIRYMGYPSEMDIKDLNDYLAPSLFKQSLDPLNEKNVLMALPDPRLSWLGWRVLASCQPCSDELIQSEDHYHNFRYFYGIPEGPKDLIPGKSLPIEYNVDFMNGISFEKGCYLGQELTARSHFTGMIRKRLMPVLIGYSKQNVKAEAKLFDRKGNKTGKLIATNDQTHGLALVKLDMQGILHHTANGTPIRINKTYWWPQL